MNSLDWQLTVRSFSIGFIALFLSGCGRFEESCGIWDTAVLEGRVYVVLFWTEGIQSPAGFDHGHFTQPRQVIGIAEIPLSSEAVRPLSLHPGE